MNTGIQRVVRGMFRGLMAAGVPVTPVLWDATLESYCTLSKRERGFLENPFGGAAGRKAHAQPSRVANPLPFWSKYWRRRIHRRNRFDLPAQATAADVLLVPQIFKDRQCVWLNGLGSRAQVRRVAVFHDAIAWRRPDITPASNIKGFVEYMLALEGFDAVVTCSRESAEDLRACWWGHARSGAHRVTRPTSPPITVIGWPVDEHFCGERRAAGASATGGKVLCVGTLEPRKNHLKLLAAAERVWQGGAKFELVLAGRTTPFGSGVEAEVERLRGAGWPVEWRQHVNDEVLLAAYDECAFTVFPTLTEGFGLPIVESLRRGRPCVCGANGVLGELAAGGGCLAVDQTDAAALAEGMRRLLTDDQLYGRLCAEARAREFETWRGYVEKLAPVLGR